MNTGIVSGVIHKIMETQRISEKFSKREIVVETPEPYSQLILVQFTNDNIDKIEGLMIGDNIEIEVNLRGRNWSNPQGEIKYFNSIEGWKIKSEIKDERKSEDIAHQSNIKDASNDLPF